MKRRWTGFAASLVILVSSCLPAVLNADAAAGGTETAVLTIYYYADRTDRKMVAAPYQAELAIGSSYRVESPSADPFVLSDPGQAVVEGVLDGDTRILVYYDDGRTMADYTVVYIGRDEENEIVLARETFRAPAGETVNAEHKEFENFGKEEGQDMTLLVTADGRAEKKVYYTRLFYDRITFRTEGTYISPISGWAGQDIGSEIDQIEEPVRQGYIFKGWDKELPDVMPEGEYVVNAVWEPGESRYTVLRWMENAEDDGYTLLGGTEVRTAQTGSTVTASREDIDRAGMMADWFPDSEYYKDYYGFDYARCEDVEVTADGRAVLNLYYDREIWTVNLHEEAEHESGTSDSLLPNDDIWYTAQGKYGAPLPADFPTMEEMEEYYMGKTQFQDVQFLGVRDEFSAVSRHLDTFYFQDLAAGNHTFDAYPWMEHDSYPVYVTYLKETADGTFRKVRVESAQVDKDPSVHGAVITVLHPKGLTCEGGWYTTGNSAEECEQKEKTPISASHIQADGKCVFRNVGSHLYVYLKRDTFTLNYIDGRSDGENVVYRTDEVAYRDWISLDYDPAEDAEHEGDRFAGWYLSPALTDSSEPLTSMRMPAEEVNVYAGWHPKEWSVKFDPVDGAAVLLEQTVQDGGKAEIPEAPQRDGYIFLGWFTAPGGRDDRQSWDFQYPVKNDMTLYAGWHPIGDAEYTVRHILEGEQDPFYVETEAGKHGDTVFVRPLLALDEGYPSDQYLESESEGERITLKQGETSVVTITYREVETVIDKEDSTEQEPEVELPEGGEPVNPDAGSGEAEEELPESGESEPDNPDAGSEEAEEELPEGGESEPDNPDAGSGETAGDHGDGELMEIPESEGTKADLENKLAQSEHESMGAAPDTGDRPEGMKGILTMAAALFIIIRITDVQTGSRGIRRTNRR